MIIDNDRPFINIDAKPVDLNVLEQKRAEAEAKMEADTPSFTKLLGAAELSYNLTARLATDHYIKDDPYASGEEFDPILKAYEHGITDEKYLDAFRNVDNQQEFKDALTYTKHQQKYDDILARGGTLETIAATLYAGALDPLIMAVPAGGLATKAKVVGGLASTVGRFVANNAPAIVASELALASGKPDLTKEEAAADVLLGVGLTGAFGAAKYAIDGVKAGKIRKELEGIAAGIKSQDPISYMDRSASAASNPEFVPTVESTTIRNNKAVGLTGEDIMSPKYRLANADEVSIRDGADRLSPNPFTTQGTVEGIARPQNVWAGVQKHLGSHALFEMDTKGAYIKYKERVRNLGERPISKRDFLNEVGNAVIDRGQPGYKHPILEADELATIFQDKYNKPLYREAIDAGALDPSFKEKVESDPDFMTRIYDNDKIDMNPTGWREKLGEAVDVLRGQEVTRLTRLVKEVEAKSASQLGKAGADVDSLKAEAINLRASLRDLTDTTRYSAYRESVVDELNATIKGYGKTGTGFQLKPVTAGPFKDRTIPLSNASLKDFINTNILDVSHRLHRLTAADVELRKSFGTSDFNEFKKTAIKEHSDIVKNITDPKELRAAEKKFKKNLSDLGTMWDMISGAQQLNDSQKVGMRFAGAITHWNYMTKMGFFPVSNIVDISSAVFVHGLSRVFGSAFDELPIVGLSKAFKKMRKADLQRYGLSTNYIHSEYMKTMMGMDDMGFRGNIVERVNKATSAAFNKASFIDRFVDWEQKKIGIISMQRVMDLAYGKEDFAGSKEWLANLGLNKRDIDGIRLELDNHGIEEGGHMTPNFLEWDDKTLADKFGNLLTTDNAVILSQNYPGALPFFFENNAGGKLMAQLSKYLIQASKLLTAGIVNRKDKHFAEFALTAVTLGIISQIASDTLKGKEIEDDWNRLLLNGIKKSGLFTALQLVDDKLLNPFDIGSEAAFGVEPNYRPSNSAEAVLNIALGPTGGMATKMFDVAAAIRNNNFNQSTVHKIRQMAPLQNVFWLYAILDEAEKIINETLNIKPAKKRHGKKTNSTGASL
jgi:hypothetical protein